MISGYHEFTKGGKIKRASKEEVCRWIEKSWSEITLQCIKIDLENLKSIIMTALKLLKKTMM
jgi:hypothetical protein